MVSIVEKILSRCHTFNKPVLICVPPYRIYLRGCHGNILSAEKDLSYVVRIGEETLPVIGTGRPLENSIGPLSWPIDGYVGISELVNESFSHGEGLREASPIVVNFYRKK